MAKCIVIGSALHAGATARLLDTSDVPTRAIEVKDHTKALAACKSEHELEVVAVFCTDFPSGCLNLLCKLRESLGPRVRIHALKDGNGGTEPTDDSLAAIRVDDVFSLASVRPVDAASSIKRKWFPRVNTTTSTGATVTRTEASPSTPVVPGKKTSPFDVLSLTARPEAQLRPSGTLVHPKLASAEKKKPVKKKSEQSDPAPQEVETVSQALGPPPFEKMLRIIKRNSVLPIEPQTISIVGKHGMIVELDPRRIKPMPDNPRWTTNPGFTPESLRRLGAGMKLIGQMEAVQVCPIVGDPDFDAQLIDGERRLRSCLLASIMIKAGVREDVMPNMLGELWLLSVARNTGKVGQTTRELVHMVSRLRGGEYRFTLEETATVIGIGIGTVVRLSILGKLHPQVQAMLDDGPEEDDGALDSGKKSRNRRTKKLTTQLALLLADFPLEEQLAKAEAISSLKYKQARRYILNERREAGFRVAGGRGGHQSRWFEALSTLTEENVNAFGVYMDMRQTEITAMMANSNFEERKKVAEDLKTLAGQLIELARRVEPKKE